MPEHSALSRRFPRIGNSRHEKAVLVAIIKQKMSRIIRKRGSHVGVVISFVLFITFIVFMYILLSLRNVQETGKSSTLEYVKGEVIGKVSSQLTTISVKVSTPGSSCVTLSNFLGSEGISNRVITLDDSGNELSTGTSGQSLQVARNGQTFFRVYEADEFPEKNSSLGSCESPSYKPGLSKTEDFVFESKVKELLANYTTSYENLKKTLNIGSRDEFGFIFTYNNGTAIKTPSQNVTVNVYASQIPVQYIKTDGAREAGSLAVLVW